MTPEEIVRLRLEILMDLRDILSVPIEANTLADIRVNIKSRIERHKEILRLADEYREGNAS